MALFKNVYEWEISRYQLSFLEQDALNNFPGKVTTDLIRELRGAVMVFQNILYELWNKGLRLRIIPKGKKFTEIAECAELSRITNKKGECVYDNPNLEGLYWHLKKLCLIKEERITKPDASNSKFVVLNHEFAHAIWYLILDDFSREEVFGIYLRARRLLGEKACQGSEMYRNEAEFFAYGFQQFILPHRQGKVLDIRQRDFGFGVPLVEVERELMAADKESLKKTNIELFEFMERKFKDIIVPEFIMPRKESPTSGDLVLKDLWFGTGLYEEIIHSE
jgi:hypothetical protein